MIASAVLLAAAAIVAVWQLVAGPGDDGFGGRFGCRHHYKAGRICFSPPTQPADSGRLRERIAPR
jgi:hypothetical protein